jgi:N-acetylgalactosamine-N,N'-diacetylbacillosaminyl-diphospho-undecaprenol 4-alpha-N-acetylgalactosaminyltransferase
MHERPPILIFINSLQTGGAERVVTHLLKHLRNDFEFNLALYTHAIDYPIPEDTRIFDLNQSLTGSAVISLLKIPLISYKLSRYCKKNKITASIAFLNRPCYANAVMRSLWGYKGKVIMCERTHQSTLINSNSPFFRFISRKLVSFAYKRADLVLANSYASRQDLIENFKVRTPIRVIYNPIDLAAIQRQAAEPVSVQFEDGIFYFISVGGFRKEKNLKMLLEAFFILKNLPVKLILVGDGLLKSQLLNKVADLELEHHVIFAGFDINPFKYIKRSHCLVLTSYVEGFPNVLLEALACEKPVIATDCKSGPREILSPGSDLHHAAVTNFEIAEHGILTPVNDVAILAASMRKMFEDESLRKSFESRALSRASQFDINEIKQYFRVAFSG